MTTHIFYNSLSGSASNKKLQTIKEYFPHAEIFIIRSQVSIEQLSIGVNNKDLVIACGGDGTISLIANIAIKKNCLLGIIPLGTGNLMAKQFKVPLTVKNACKLIKEKKHVERVDALKIQNRHYFVNIGAGKVAKIVRDVAAQKKRRWGMLTYIVSAIKYLFFMKKTLFSITIDGKTHHTTGEELLVLNIGHLGLHNLSVDVNPTDGIVEVFILKRRTHFDLVPLATHFLLGRKCNVDLLKRFDVKESLTVHSNPSVPLQADGDIISNTPFTMQVKKQCLNIITTQ